MALNISLWLVPWSIFLVALIVIVVAIIVLVIVERRVHKRVVIRKEEEETYYQRRLNAVKMIKDNEKFVSAMDKIAKEFFSENFEIGGQSYSDLIDVFKKKKKDDLVKFSEGMEEAFYSGEEINRAKMNGLLDLLEGVIEREREIKKLQVKKVEKKKEIEPSVPVKGKIEEKKEIVPVKVEEKENVVPKKEVVRMPIEVFDSSKEAKIEKKVEKKGWLFGKKEEKKVSMNLVRYMEEGLRRGFGIELLEKKLIDAKFPEDDVKMAIDYVSKNFVQEKKVEEKKEIVPVKVEEEEIVPVKKKGFFARLFGGSGEKIEKFEKTREPKIILPDRIEVPIKKTRYPANEPEQYGKLGSIDNLERIKKKIKENQKKSNFKF